MKTKLDNTRDNNSSLKKTIDEVEGEKRKLEQQFNETRLQLEEFRRHADDYSRERDHSKHQLETTNYEKSNLEKVRMVSSRRPTKYPRNQFLSSLIYSRHWSIKSIV